MDKYSFLNTIHPSQLEDLYEQYLKYPDSIEPSLRAFFQGFDFGSESALNSAETISDSNRKPKDDESCDDIIKEFQVIRLIDGYRTRGHLFTKTNPVRERRQYEPTLDIENFGLSRNDLDLKFQAGEIIGIGIASLKEIIRHLEKTYCDSIGIEYMYIRNPDKIEWIQQYLNKTNNQPDFNADKKKRILQKLTEAVGFEHFLHTKYVGQKRFSLEGGESLIPALDILIENAAEKGVKEFVMGMAHRGRLNTLTNIFGKSAKDIFTEFDGKDYVEDIFDGDVKYHLGWTSQRNVNGKEINLNIAPNPSHLEAVGAVVQGIARAKQDDYYKDTPESVLPIVVHGDAAIAGQGIVYEIVQMAQLEGYKTGGTIHIVINNQVGFTTNYLDGRSSLYCTDVAKVTFSPILHVNSDDAEAVVQAMLFALEFRMAFNRDVFIDLLGYRKYGHNEGDEPRFTQPKLYKIIASHKNAKEIYAGKLIAQGVIDENVPKEMETQYKALLEEDFESSRKEENATVTPIMQNMWEGFEYSVSEEKMLEQIDTTIDLEELTQIAKKITELPADKKFIRKIERLINSRREMFFEKNKLDWAMGELLAYGSIVDAGNDVRMSGQDVERGTFSHRHAIIKVEDSEEELCMLNDIKENQGDFYIYNSLLSEYAVVGFEYGYAMASPKSLVLWEAQFGDFVNGAQIMIDQYISAAEDKWKLQNGLVMLLPHGYEGQGAEHSSARMERFLQLCATNNMYVADVTTPANFFHLLRRQVLMPYRKPLIVFTPKSLLRHPKVVSTKEELATGSFQMIIDDAEAKVNKVKSLVFVTGKFYYDLLDKREELKRDDVALVRIEQLFPLPKKEIREIIKKYKNADDLVWAQEEPKNMGAYSFLLLHLEEAVNFRVCSRKMYAAPASGSSVRSFARHAKVIESVFDRNQK